MGNLFSLGIGNLFSPLSAVPDILYGSATYTVLGDTGGYFVGYLNQPSETDKSLWDKWVNTYILQYLNNLFDHSNREEEVSPVSSSLTNPITSLLSSLSSFVYDALDRFNSIDLDLNETLDIMKKAKTSERLSPKIRKEDCRTRLWDCLEEAKSPKFRLSQRRISRKFSEEKYIANLRAEMRSGCKTEFFKCKES